MEHKRFDSHRKMSTISSTSVLSFLTWSRLATVTIGTYWSLSIWEMRYMSLARFSLRGRGGLFSGEHISLRCRMTQHLLSIRQLHLGNQTVLNLGWCFCQHPAAAAHLDNLCTYEQQGLAFVSPSPSLIIIEHVYIFRLRSILCLRQFFRFKCLYALQ